MRKSGRLLAAFCILNSAFCIETYAVETTPVINAQVLGGQYYYQGSESAVGGLLSVNASPFLKLNDRWSLVPLYSGAYRGTKQVTDLIGGGTLFQDSQNHNFSNKAILSLNEQWRVKMISAYGMEFLRETTDEGWGDGLYDNRRLSAGSELEWLASDEQSVRLGFDYYRIRFPNYRSLESQTVLPGLGRELNQPDVLDNSNIALNLGAQTRVPGSGVVEFAGAQTFRGYSDQLVVDEAGNLTPEKRGDTLTTLGLTGTWPVFVSPARKIFASIAYSWAHLSSNQHHFDASKVVFNRNYYGYSTQSLNTHWTFVTGERRPWKFRLQGSIARQSYSDRLTQDSVGTYGTETTDVDLAYAGFSFSYPIAKNFNLMTSTYLAWSDSNNTYTQVYRYHYNAATYLMGFTYAY
jgi:hypothetical protein